MKRLLGFCFAVTFTLVLSGTALAQSIVGSAHDFSSAAWNTSDQICIVCHTTHNADVSVSDAPLWNHEMTSATFTPYSSASMNATVGQPDASSKLCMSCHDGTIAVDNYGGQTGGSHFITGNSLVGTDLSDDHPVSFTYDAALANSDGGLYDPTTANSGMGGTISNDMLIGGKVQCASCHDVHNSQGFSKLLIISNSSSALCLTCHNK
ncbi:MAG: cytochrome c3 family protein [Calditrichaceae bacterium]